MNTIWQDIRYGLRMLVKNPGFSAVAILTLALGIGANTAIFTVVNAVLLRDLPYPQPERLVMLFHTYPKLNLPRATVSPIAFTEYQRVLHSYEKIGAFSGYRAPQNFTGEGQPQRVRCVMVSAGFFPTLGIAPLKGRVFLPEEDQPGKNRVGVLSYGLWQSYFGGVPDVVGKTFTLDGATYGVIGVMPSGFQMPRGVDLWIPIAFTPQEAQSQTEYLNVLARLAPSVSMQQADSELERVSAEIRKQYNIPPDLGWGVVQVSLRELTVGDIRPALLVLLAAVGFVLLIACVNLANLLLARAASRQKEIAIRLALGAGRWRMARQLVTESVLLGLIGGAAGILLAVWGLAALLRVIPIDLPSFVVVKMDPRVLGFTALLSVLTGLLFGSIPALHAAHTALNDTLKEGGQSSTAGAARHRTRGVLVTLEVGLALVLLVGAGLMIRSFAQLQRVDQGFDPRGVLTMRLSLPQGKYAGPDQMTAFYSQLHDRLAGLPGVEKVGMASSLPLVFGSSASFFIEGKELKPEPHAYSGVVSPDYFSAMRIGLVKGRYFEDRDARGSAPVAIIDERAAATYWPGEDPIGKRLNTIWEKQGDQQVWREIVGVVRAVKHTSALVDDTKGQVYTPLAQIPSRSVALAIRAAGDPASLTAAVRREVLALDSDQPIYDANTMDKLLENYVAQPRFNMYLLAAFAALSLLLAAVGIYGVVSYSVSQRTHEIGIRMALGAQARDVFRLVITHGMGLALIGLLEGLVGSWLLTRFLDKLLFGIKVNDSVTFLSVAALLAMVALVACYLPARRATRVDPIVALRYE